MRANENFCRSNTFSKLAAHLLTYCRVSCLVEISKNIYHIFIVAGVVDITTNAYVHKRKAFNSLCDNVITLFSVVASVSYVSSE